MSKKSNPLDYITFNKKQGDNFLSEVENIVLNELDRTGNQSSIHKYDNNKFKKYGFYVEVINGIKSPLKNYYFLRKDVFNPLSQNTDYICKGISYKTIEKFMVDYFSNYDLANPENNAIDIGKLESITLKEIKDRNNIVKRITEIAGKLEAISMPSFDQDEYKTQLEQNDWALWTYGEKIIEDQHGTATRIFYIKERPVRFENKKIILKNTDSAIIEMRKDIRNRKGIIITESNPRYEGDYQVFKRKNAKPDSILYLETDALHGGNQRHFRLILAFGKEIEEIGLGTFTLIKDFGPLLSGAALLVKKENQDDKKSYFENTKCKLYNSFTNYDDNAIPRPIRMLLEKRSRAYIKLPRALDNHTLDNLESYLFAQKKERERNNYEPREVIIHRKDAFISIPLNCNGTETAKKYETLLKKSVEILKAEPFNLTKITYGTKNRDVQESSATASTKKSKFPIESPGSKNEYESNFDKIIQSNLVIFIFPAIEFPYELEPYDPKKESNGNSIHISTAFMEMGFAIGLRKKILILTSDKVLRTFPSIVKKFAEGENVKIIKCEVDTLNNRNNAFKIHKKSILEFLDKHLDYKIIEE